ncbi:hypothetical protein K443DRAFT_340224 [Laccaria amethystina LaAM-08-1]|uniref:Uncharacterized protein n=1 Tax=Laccaria amethystina LaAM-08-1 TaxID=1095629 RepID=A0A0C9WJP0_9AGAR|nr:hypothetical protein K443DRAFT_340224 [Laccaria amethystina LaAM-08-1]
MEMAQADRDLIDAEGMDEEHGSRIVLVLLSDSSTLNVCLVTSQLVDWPIRKVQLSSSAHHPTFNAVNDSSQIERSPICSEHPFAFLVSARSRINCPIHTYLHPYIIWVVV